MQVLLKTKSSETASLLGSSSREGLRVLWPRRGSHALTVVNTLDAFDDAWKVCTQTLPDGFDPEDLQYTSVSFGGATRATIQMGVGHDQLSRPWQFAEVDAGVFCTKTSSILTLNNRCLPQSVLLVSRSLHPNRPAAQAVGRFCFRGGLISCRMFTIEDHVVRTTTRKSESAIHRGGKCWRRPVCRLLRKHDEQRVERHPYVLRHQCESFANASASALRR